MNSGIYGIVHKDSGRSYIGSSRDIRARFQHHKWALRNRRHGNSHLMAAVCKYGIENFDFLLLETVENEADLVVREQIWLDNTPVKYNLRKLAESNRGMKRSEEQKAKLRGRVVGQETRELLRQVWAGKTLSEEHREKISLAKQGTVISEETRLKMSLSSNRTCVMTPEQRARAANTRAKEYIVTSPTNETFQIRNLRAFCRENNLLQGSHGRGA